MVGPFDVDRYLDGLFDFLHTQEKLFSKKETVSGVKGYIGEARKKTICESQDSKRKQAIQDEGVI